MRRRDGLRGNLRKKRSAWCRPAGGRSARSPVILGLGYRRWFAGLVEPGSACGRSIGSRERCDGGAEAAAPGERDPSPERDILKKATVFFACGKSTRPAAHRWAKAEFPSTACAACRVSAKAANISPERLELAAANATTWCCWPMSGRPFPCRTYGSPRMTREIRICLLAGRRRIAR